MKLCIRRLPGCLAQFFAPSLPASLSISSWNSASVKAYLKQSSSPVFWGLSSAYFAWVTGDAM